MDYTLQVHEAKYVFPIPDGLKELSSDIIREVLRHQPKNINGFIADYLETMLAVRENARDSDVVICNAFRDARFFDELFRTKKVTREQTNTYATTIQAAWRGYVVRKKISEWLKKKKKFSEEQQRKRSLKIEELLAGLGITYDEAKRAAEVIQEAYKVSKRGKWIPGEAGEYWVEEIVPLGQRIREGDRAQGRYDRWEKEDFGDFFEMDESGAIKYIWPRVGQLRKVLREEVPMNVPIVEFFGMRDLDGQEQYSYLIKPQSDAESRGAPIGFLIPVPKSCVMEYSQEVEFVDPENIYRMGYYTYIFQDDVDRKELKKFEELLKTQAKVNIRMEEIGEFDYDPNWVLPRVLVRIKKEFLLETDDEVKFGSLPEGLICEQENYTFRAESFGETLKIIRHIIRNECVTVEEGLLEAANMSPYKFQETGRIFPVEKFTSPSYIQKIEITPESDTAEDESLDLMRYNYIFLPLDSISSKKFPKGQPIFSISIIRFQGFHSDYKGSADLENKVFIMGPKITTPNGKPFTYESLFWEEFGIEAWYQLQYNYESLQKEEEEEEEEEVEEEGEADKMMGESSEERETFTTDETTKIRDIKKPVDLSQTSESKGAIVESLAGDGDKVPSITTGRASKAFIVPKAEEETVQKENIGEDESEEKEEDESEEKEEDESKEKKAEPEPQNEPKEKEEEAKPEEP